MFKYECNYDWLLRIKFELSITWTINLEIEAAQRKEELQSCSWLNKKEIMSVFVFLKQ